MKINKSYMFLMASALMLGACSENAWNDDLEGFKEPSPAEGVKTATYTLTSEDYSTIASLEANTAIAESEGEEETAALAAIGKNGTFVSDEQARKYIPALLATTDKGLPYYTYNENSNVKVSYNVETELPEAVRAINAGVKTYKVTEEDYQLSWGSEEYYIEAFAPKTTAAENLPVILENNVSAKEGDYVIANYYVASRNPDFDGYDYGADWSGNASEENAAYKYDGKDWKLQKNVVVLSKADYTAMGSTYGNLSGSQPDSYLPIYLKSKFPYAYEGDSKILAYLYYASGSTAYRAKEYVLENDEWRIDAGVATSQFTKIEGKWKFNPSIVIDLPYSRNTDPSYTYYMACVDWVYENICVPMGDTSITSGKYFIDYRGNAEFYSGASAYYGNVDIRASSALSHMPDGYTGYEGLSNDQITLLMKKRFCTETFPAALEKLNADMAPAADMDVTVTVNLTAYDGDAVPTTVVYLVTAPGKFKYQSSTWVEEGEDKDW